MECLSMRGYHKEMTRDTEKLPTSFLEKKDSGACDTVSIGNGDADEK